MPTTDVSKPKNDQSHLLLAFLSGRFNSTQLGRSILQKEAFAVLNKLDRMHWLVSDAAGFDLYTDHDNLIFLFDLLSVVPDMSQTSLRKVLRWYVRSIIYQYTCYHIKGSDNVWVYLVTLWFPFTSTVGRPVHITELPSACSEDFECPTPSGISESQTPQFLPALMDSHLMKDFQDNRMVRSGYPTTIQTSSYGYASSDIPALPATEVATQPKNPNGLSLPGRL